MLRRIGLLDYLTVDLAVSPQTVIHSLSKKIDDYQPDWLDLFRINKKEYKGYIGTDSLEIKKAKQLMGFEHWAKATGQMNMENEKVIFTIEISAPASRVATGFILLLLIFSTVGLIVMFSALLNGDTDGFFVGLQVFTAMTVFLVPPIYVMKWSVSNLKSDLEDELKSIGE